MTTLALPHPELRSRGALHVERTDIHFFNVAPDRVAIELTITNHSGRRSQPTSAILEAAPLGAFVPWQPLGVLQVPGLDPEESVTLQTEASPRTPKPLGTPDRVPPRQLLVALGAEDDQPQARVRRGRLRQSDLSDSGLIFGQLPADPFQLLGRGGVHWAGNLNVFVGGTPVERHTALAVRIYPGKLNVAMFVVGSGRDAYRFHLEGDGADWDAALHGMNSLPSLLRGRCEGAVPLADWVQVQSQEMMMLSLCPPRDCGPGSVEVHVQQRSTGKTAVVEFSLDPRAAGAGCYVVG